MKILLIPSAVGLSHLTRLLLIALELRERGAQVAFAYREEHALLKQAGFTVYPVQDIHITDFSSNVFSAYTSEIVQRCVEDERATITEFRPDVIVGDFRLSAAISSRHEGIPYISVVNAYMTDYFNPVDVMMSASQRPLQYRLASWTGNIIQRRQRFQLAAPFRAAARHFGLRDLNSLYDFLRGDRTLIADLPELYPLSKLPETYQYIGPLIWEGLVTNVPASFKNLNKAKSLIYATTGNTGNVWLLQLTYEAFAGDPNYEVIMTTGYYLNTADLPSAPNIYVERFAPGSQIIPHVQAVIYSGGNGTMYQVLAAGKPSIVIPFNSDQAINAWVIHTRKLGYGLSASTPKTADDLRQALATAVADPIMGENLPHFQNLLKHMNGPERAAQTILQYAQSGFQLRA